MSERDPGQHDSPLVSERGRTTISDSVVSRIAGMAAQEVEGVHMGGSASRAAGGIVSSITGSGSQTRGVSTEIGTVETAIDLTMGIEYGRDILQTVEEVRRRISERVQSMTGLRVTELNTTINDIVFPEGRPRRRTALSTSDANAETRALPEREREATAASPDTESEPSGGDETAELRSEDVAETRQTPDEDETRRAERREES
jgi:uncharacterized alkaline shock family protein YloU